MGGRAQTTPDPVRREGLTILHDPADCELDLVIIHGLNGSPYRTFYDESTAFYWPSDLAKSLPTARIMVFGYIADFNSGSSNDLGVYQHGESLLLHLKNNRISHLQAKRPLVFLGHSLGGVVIKQALVTSAQRKSDNDILNATKLVVFLGTPHRGSHLLDKSISKMGLSVMKLASREVPKNVKAMLQPRANESFIVNTEFMRVKGQIAIVNFYEQMPRHMLQDLVVDKDSAVFDSESSENIPVARDHEHLVRFQGPNDDAYHMLCQTLQRKVMNVLEVASKTTKEGYSQRMMRACLRSLEDSSMPSSLTQSKEPHHKTLSWLWEPKSGFLNWLQNGSGLFVITGKPGSGKSLLMGEVTTRIRKTYRSKFAVVVQHAFNARGTLRDHSFEGFLRLAIVQILRRLPSSFDAMHDDWLEVVYDCGITEAEMYDLEDVDAITWPVSNLKKALRSIVAHVAQRSRVCFIIDALDECDDGTSDGKEEVASFLSSLVDGESAPASKDKISICLSCRERPNVTSAAAANGFRMEDRNGPDIMAYINDRWSTFTSLASASDEMKLLKAELIRKADGIFLWAHLALERIQTALRDGATVAELREAVDDIPKELEGLFALLIGSINPRYATETNTMLAIVLAAHRPLSLGEFRYVMALSASPAMSSHKELTNSDNIVQDDAAMRRRIQSRCGGLLEVKVVKDTWLDDNYLRAGHTNVIQFMHQSVRDYLLDPDRVSVAEKADKLTTEGHVVLARGSIQYLALKEVQERASHFRAGFIPDKPSQISRKDDLPLLTYAVEFGFHHCQEAEKHGMPQAELIDQQFGSEDQTFENYVFMYNMIHQGEKYSLGYSLLHLAVENNLAKYVDMHLTRNPGDVNVLLEGGQSCVQVAVWLNHKETLEVLLKYNANANLPVSYSNSYSQRYAAPHKVPYQYLPPLVVACNNGNNEMVELLLEHGADVSECTVSYDSMHINQALLAAAYSGKIDIVQKLMEADPVALAHPEIRLSAIVGLRHIVEELLSDESGGEHHRPMNKDDTSSKRLDANVQMMRKISELIFQGIEVRQLDLVSISLTDFWFLTGCYHEVLQRLLDLGTDFSGADGYGFSFLHAACFQGTVASVRLLYQNGGDPTITFGSFDASCLQIALRNQSPAVLEYLLSEIKLPIDDVDRFGNTALHDAARDAPGEFINILLAHGASKALFNSRGARPFHQAIHNRKLKDHVGMLQELLYQESDVCLPDNQGLTPLHMAAGCGALPVVDWLLLRKGVSVEACDDSGRTVLHLAASCLVSDSTDVLERLLESFKTTPLISESAWSTSAMAVSKTTEADAERLREVVNARDSADMTPLHHLFWTYHSLSPRFRDFDPAVTVTNAKLLLRHRADLSARDNAGNTALHLAAWRGIKELVRVFLRAGADPNVKDENGLRPLDLADMEDVRELLEDAMAVQSGRDASPT